MKGDVVPPARCSVLTMRSLAIDTHSDTSSTRRSGQLTREISSESIERLQMANNFAHIPVLASEVTDFFAHLPVGVVVDATLGGGGHAELILSANPNVRLLGIDRDAVARSAASSRLARFGERVRVSAGTFGELRDIRENAADFVGTDPIVGVLADLGVSSPQLDDPTRGFSFREDAPLDMRMDSSTGFTAAELITTFDARELTQLLREHGEGRFAPAIARAVIATAPQTTGELVAAVERAVPMGARRRGHVATRVFQALRVRVNDEEGQLEAMLSGALDLLAPEGVLVVISYHSGEDKVVKAQLATAATGGCTCPVALGCVCGAVPRVRLLKASAIMASDEEIAQNPRARSARLRVAWKVPA